MWTSVGRSQTRGGAMFSDCVRAWGRRFSWWGCPARTSGTVAKRSGIVAGFVLGALLLLPALARADGFIIIERSPVAVRGHFSFAPLEVSYHHVEVSIKDQIATTS